MIELADGEAVAVFAAATRQTIIDPRTGRPAEWPGGKKGVVRAACCAEADALATATLLEPAP